MINRETVIKGLGIHSDRSDKTDCDDCPYSKDGFTKGDCIGQLCKDALALLKEQEPKQIVRKQGKREHPDGSIDYFGEWYCPHCGKLLKQGFDAPWIECCYKCGEPILWEDR